MYKYVIFDVGGTLVRWADASVFAQFLSDHALKSRPNQLARDASDLRQMMIEGFDRQRGDAVGMGAMGSSIVAFWREVLGDVIALWQRPGYSPQLLEAFTQAVLDGLFDVPFEDTLETLQRLSTAGYRLGVISNWNENLPNELARLDLARYFDFVIVSSLVGVAKPAPEIFHLGLAQARCQAHEALYVGDNVMDDCVGARRAGLEVALIDRRGSSQPSASQCTEVYGSLRALASALLAQEDMR